ncbi:MAG: hypothetical protein JXR83_09460 [Deltaproteobacteria bacterium]|nr:hypothetical protein [Deltaproteobacteria bacterium]
MQSKRIFVAVVYAVSFPLAAHANQIINPLICRFSPSENDFECDSEKMKHFEVVYGERFTEIEDPTLGAKFTMLFRDGGDSCPIAIEAVLRHPAKDILVDWKKVSIVVNNEAKQSIPGYARRVTASLEQKPSVAPVGSILKEDIYLIEGNCLLTKYMAKDRKIDTVSLIIPVEIENTTYKIGWTWNREWRSISEYEAMKNTPRPVLTAQPETIIDIEDSEPFGFLFSIIGGGICLVISPAPCALWAFAMNFPDSWDQIATTPQVATAICFGSLLGPVIGPILLAGGIALDRIRVAMFDSDKKESVAYEYSKKAQAAYDKKMEALQIMLKSTPNSQPSQSAPASSSDVELEQNGQSY